MKLAQALELSTIVELSDSTCLRILAVNIEENDVYLLNEDSGEEYNFAIDSPELKGAKLLQLVPLEYEN